MNLQLGIVVWVLQDLWGFPKWQYWAVASAVPTAAANAAAPCPFGYQQTSPRLAKSSPVVRQIGKTEVLHHNESPSSRKLSHVPEGTQQEHDLITHPVFVTGTHRTARTKNFGFLGKEAMEKLLILQFFYKAPFLRHSFPSSYQNCCQRQQSVPVLFN